MANLLTKLTPQQWRAKSLCKGWSIEDVAAHIIVREGLIGPIGIVIPKLHKLHDNRVKKLETKGHKAIIKELKKYPWYMPAAVNIAEYYIHCEDMLRGELKMIRPAPDKEESQILWKALQGLVKIRKDLVADLGSVQIENTQTGAVITLENKHSEEDTIIAGLPGELLLFVYGRRDAAKVKITTTKI